MTPKEMQEGGDSHKPVTELLARWKQGEQEALKTLIPLVYDELRRVAHSHLKNEHPGQLLQSTALVHEAYLRLAGREPLQLENRAHFFAVASQLMRQILVDYARRRRATKRDPGSFMLALDEDLVKEIALPKTRDVALIALDDALNGLSAMDARQCHIVELRFFGGLSINEIAGVLEISPATIKREWTTARAWLYREIAGA